MNACHVSFGGGPAMTEHLRNTCGRCGGDRRQPVACEHCGKVWQFGHCDSTVSRRARCEYVSAERETKQ